MVKYKKQIDYLKTLLPFKTERNGIFLAGGAITSIFNGQPIKDFDLYFNSQKVLSDTFEDLISEGWWCTFLTSKSLTLTKNEQTVQLIFFDYFSNPDAIFHNFDYTINMGAYDFNKDEIVLHEDFLIDNSSRSLKFNQFTRYPIISLLRINKYREKGYHISANEILKIGLAVTLLKITNWEEFEDQVGGVYGTKLVPIEQLPTYNINRAIHEFDSLFVKDEEIPSEEELKRVLNLPDSFDFDF